MKYKELQKLDELASHPYAILLVLILLSVIFFTLFAFAKAKVFKKLKQEDIPHFTKGLYKAFYFYATILGLGLIVYGGIRYYEDKRQVEAIKKSAQYTLMWSIGEGDQLDEHINLIKSSVDAYACYENLILYAISLNSLQKYDEALAICDRIEHSSNPEINKKTKELYFCKQAALYGLGKDRLDEAIEANKKIITADADIVEKNFYNGKALYNIASYLLKKYNFSKATADNAQAYLDSAKKCIYSSKYYNNSTPRKTKAMIWFITAEIDLLQGDILKSNVDSFQRVTFYYNKAIGILENINRATKHSSDLGQAYNDYADFLINYLSNKNEAITYLNNAVLIFNSSKDLNRLGYAHATLGELYQSLGMDSLAYHNFFMSKQSFEEAGDPDKNLKYVDSQTNVEYNRQHVLIKR